MYHPQYGQAPSTAGQPTSKRDFKFKLADGAKWDWIYEKIHHLVNVPGEAVGATPNQATLGANGLPTVFDVSMVTSHPWEEVQKVFESEVGVIGFAFAGPPEAAGFTTPVPPEPTIVVPELVDDEGIEEEEVYVPPPAVVPYSNGVNGVTGVAKPAIPWVMLAVVGIAAFLIGRVR